MQPHELIQWLGSLASEIVLVFFILKIKIHRRFPVFFAYIIFDITRAIVLPAILYSAPLSGHYYYAYWKDLRQHCRLVSRDVIQITGFAQRHVSICFHNHRSSYSNDRYKMAAMTLFMQENKSLRADGVVITVLYFISLVIGPLVKQTKAAMDRYSTMWLPLFEQYTIENPECQGHF